MQLSFGSGAVWGERTDVTGTGIGPRQFGVLQDIRIDFDWTDKPLYGQLQFPLAIARGHEARSPVRPSSPRSWACCIPTSSLA